MKVDTQFSVLTARVPLALIKQLDKRAKASGRSRSAEVLMRLRQSLKELPKSMAAKDAAAEPAAQVAQPLRATHGR